MFGEYDVIGYLFSAYMIGWAFGYSILIVIKFLEKI